MNRKQKEELVETLHKYFVDSSSIIVTHINGLTVSQSTELRTIMRNSNCKFKVTKNRLTKLALEETNFKDLANLFSGPTAIAYSNDLTELQKIESIKALTNACGHKGMILGQQYDLDAESNEYDDIQTIHEYFYT